MGRPTNTGERQTQIARALLHVMAKHGYDGASVADIANEAGIAPGLVHYHFKNKLEILLAAIAELASDQDARLVHALAEASDDPARELRAFIDAHLRTGRSADPAALACWINITGEALREPRVRKVVRQLLSMSASRLREILERGIVAGSFTCAEPAVVAGAILATIQGYFVLAATTRELIPEGSAAPATLSMAMALLRTTPPTRRATRRPR